LQNAKAEENGAKPGASGVKEVPPDTPENIKQRDEDKAKQDRRLADYTEFLFFATMFLGIATAGLVVVAYCQMRESRQSIDATVKLARAAVEHADHADRAIKVSEDTAKRQLRAYVFVVSGDISWGGSEAPFVTIIARNYGMTPAYAVEMSAMFEEVDIGMELIFPDFGNHSTARVGVVAPRSQFKQIQVFEKPRRRVGDATPRRVLAWGEIRYKDAFGDPQWSRYCLGTIDQNGSKMEPTAIGNEAS
jgi:hypothetical protein